MLAFLQLVADILQRQKSTEHQLQTRVSNVFVELCLIFFWYGLFVGLWLAWLPRFVGKTQLWKKGTSQGCKGRGLCALER